jgi:Predicted integral membrane protein
MNLYQRPIRDADCILNLNCIMNVVSHLLTRYRTLSLALLVTSVFFLENTPAKADLRACNLTQHPVTVSLGYRDAQGWVTEGWWNLNATACETLLTGPLASRFYYIHAIDAVDGKPWPGRSFMCTRNREFTIRGVENCLARGFDRSAYFEVDTGEQKSWTIQLTDQNRP